MITGSFFVLCMTVLLLILEGLGVITYATGRIMGVFIVTLYALPRVAVAYPDSE